MEYVEVSLGRIFYEYYVIVLAILARKEGRGRDGGEEEGRDKQKEILPVLESERDEEYSSISWLMYFVKF